MSDDDSYPRNPDYGKGCYRRRILLSASEGQTRGDLEDDNHGFCVTVRHDGQYITAIEAETRRTPFTTCSGAGDPLQKLVGLKLTDNSAELILQTQPQANCTHLFDLSILAICQTARFLNTGESQRQYDIRLEDQQAEGSANCEIFRDGQRIHHWQTRDWVIQSPSALAGKVLFKGFKDWASQTFSGDEAEAAFALQKGYFVGNARQYNLRSLIGETADSHREYMYGVCYTYTSPQIEKAVRITDSIRDFTDTPEQLLRFSN
ncbi:DUF2889 domain-containing protein [Spongiibacter sp. KMU-158]|uniref:DUF2889 domain-containing protein n=1 Tax=Spongiibacter pelagi TaxID=2760804 RepID=A0A927BYP2_9GAMM|nr:DUF2889 domain-containing protein [Spongiibacter pelagi]MBD2857469.1 DUF2889 domain-containing protein [Spongiibacter pelagi]